jgi:hypothetical protein
MVGVSINTDHALEQARADAAPIMLQLFVLTRNFIGSGESA